MPDYRTIDVHDCFGTLVALYREYQGKACASFEGDLRGLELHELPGCTLDETAGLKRQTRSPRLDFVVVPLSKENIRALSERLSRPGVLGRNGSVVHTQLEVDGALAFAACDNFDRHCTFASQAIPEALLAKLQGSGVVRHYE